MTLTKRKGVYPLPPWRKRMSVELEIAESPPAAVRPSRRRWHVLAISPDGDAVSWDPYMAVPKLEFD